MIVDVIHTLPHDQSDSISSHHIYNGNGSIHQTDSSMELANERHFMSSNESATIPVEHQSLHSIQNQLPTDHRSHFHSNSIEDNRKVIIGEQGRQYVLTNEAPVIVLNKVKL